VLRGYVLGTAPVFPVPVGDVHISATADALCLVAGLTGGLLAVAATWLVYRAEDGFARLPVHWMWWPAIGGLIIGIGGLFEPRALGVGYDVIDQLLTGKAALSLVIGILVVKTAIWSLSLGSGTSGGVLAPVFMIGSALGALEGHLFPAVFAGFWAMMGLAAVVGGVMRAPLTGIVFTLELTHAWAAVLPLMITATAAYALSTLLLKRSILTEKIARRGLHLTREYSTDPLECFFASEVLTPAPATAVEFDGVVDGAGVVVYGSDTLRTVAYLFAEHGLTHAPVIDDGDSGRLLGVITVADLLHARLHDLTEEHRRERHLPAPRNRSRRPHTTATRHRAPRQPATRPRG
jgi:CIC family chloride channel protein